MKENSTASNASIEVLPPKTNGFSCPWHPYQIFIYVSKHIYSLIALLLVSEVFLNKILVPLRKLFSLVLIKL
jgi:hypothetical protein